MSMSMSARIVQQPVIGGGHRDVSAVPVKQRRAAEWLERKRKWPSLSCSSSEGGRPNKRLAAAVVQTLKPSLLAAAAAAKVWRRDLPEKSGTQQLLEQEEAEILEKLDHRTPLKSVFELAKGITYNEPLSTGWKPPSSIRRRSEAHSMSIRKRNGILVEEEEDDDVPSPIKTFEQMRFPKPILDQLKSKGILKPTPIQMQGLPVALSGRDLIGVSFTGSGKTLVFVLPLVMTALQEELSLSIIPGEGPFCLVVCPSRELATQTHQVIQQFLHPLRDYGYPELRSLLCIGGVDMKPQIEAVRSGGVHIVVATPGRLKAMLSNKTINLNNCRFLTLDEADRLVDLGFEDDISQIFDHFKAQRQTLLFSATMPTKIHNLARSSLVKPITVKVGMAGGANLNVIQEVEYVKQEAKMVYLLECLQKTPPPVLIFCANKADVDRVHEYLLIKGVDVVAIHGGKDQEERDSSISSFKLGKKDVLIATDVASKGLDFPNIHHVINYEMPPDIENYVHRIGRTGRCGKTGVSTTFVNKDQSKTNLLDLKCLLQEAKQRIPPVLAALEDPIGGGVQGCACCGGLGHRISECPKLENQKRKLIAGSMRDCFGSGVYRSEI